MFDYGKDPKFERKKQQIIEENEKEKEEDRFVEI